MRTALPASKLTQLWQQIVAKAGSFQNIKGSSLSHVQGTAVVVVTVQFSQTAEGLEWSFSSSGTVTGLHLVPAETTSWTPPTYDHPASFTRTPLTIGPKPLSVPAVLDRPKGTGPFPAVVLVPGSGPENFNEQISGPEEPFRDIADGLASAGIEVLRYDKPTYSDASAFSNPSRLTPKDSDLIDAQAAIATLAKQPSVEPGGIFVLGHSAGGYWAPWLAQHTAHVRGLILLAAPTRPLAAYLVPQARYLDQLNGPLTAKEKKALNRLQKEVQTAMSPNLSPATPTRDLPLGLPASYWSFYSRYSATQTAADLTMPLLFLQGSADYQVPPATLTQWRQALAHHANATFKLFPHLDHLFMTVSGKSTPADYQLPGHVSAAVIQTCAEWIHQEASQT